MNVFIEWSSMFNGSNALLHSIMIYHDILHHKPVIALERAVFTKTRSLTQA